MLNSADLLLLLCLTGGADALYKQWIPDTNYENKSNWDKGSVPCGSDSVRFSAQKRVSVFVETTHAVQELRLPMDGEFIFNQNGAGFYVWSEPDPDCGAGVTAQFKDADGARWFDPSLWQTAATQDNILSGEFLFSVHEESVPCWYDDVLFKANSSFRVDTSSGQDSVPVKSVSVLGKRFFDGPEFAQYLGSHLGRLQFHGFSTVTVGNPGCEDPTGCECGNTANRDRICSSVSCAPLNCKEPLHPVGHCCEVCGAIIHIRYTPEFRLESYRDRIYKLFVASPPYKSIGLGMSKVSMPQRLMGMIPFGSSSEIQVVILDGDSGALAKDLAQSIVDDAQSESTQLGIKGVELQTSSEGSSSQTGASAGVVIGAVFGALILLTLVIVLGTLVHRGQVRMPSMPSLPSLRIFKSRNSIGDLGGPLDQGFENPMFDNPGMMPDIVSLDERNSVSINQAGGVYFINPVYDESETDFNA